MMLPSLTNLHLGRSLPPALVALGIVALVFFTYTQYTREGAPPFESPIVDYTHLGDRRPPTTNPPPRYIPVKKPLPPRAIDPFPLLATSTGKPPPIPRHNIPRPNLHRDYNLAQPPPLFIGFTRQWPILLQAVVSYITAGWPPEHIYVVENTGVHNSNKHGKLTLQNPFYLNHTTLHRLGVQVVQTPVLLTFAQLQNFFLSLAYEHNHPYYFYSHQDVVVFSYEDGFNDLDKETPTIHPAAGQPGYRTIYENCLHELSYVINNGERWGLRFFDYDRLTLINRAAMEAVGGWDSWIPYYGTDCDMHNRLLMDGWTAKTRRVGFIYDVSTIISDLAVFYRDPDAKKPKFIDPNPPLEMEDTIIQAAEDGVMPTDSLAYFRILNQLGQQMAQYKTRSDLHLRNTWQFSQYGGKGEPFYYDSQGFFKAFCMLAGAGQKVYQEKWGHRGCNLVEDTGLQFEDQWLVEHDWVSLNGGVGSRWSGDGLGARR